MKYLEKLSDKYLSLRSDNFMDIFIENYALIEIIGKGGFGIVFKAYSKIQKKYVALKFLDPETTSKEDSYRRVIREINNAQKIKDKRIVSIYSIENWEGIIFLVMELYEGETLKEYLDGKTSTWREFKSMFLEILEGVKVLHDNQIIHRDLKLSNIFITSDSQIVLLDFGLSKKMDEQTATLTTDKMLGTIAYMSPEQLNPIEGIDLRSDIYQLGLILYMMIYDKLPYEGDTASIMSKKLYSKPQFPSLPDSKLPKYLQFGIAKALEREPANRFNSISDMIEYFEKEHYPFLGRTIQRIKKNPMTTVISIIFLILISFLAYLFISNHDQIDKVEYNGSNMKVYNPFGIKLFERNFKDKKIQYAAKQFFDSIDHNANKQLNPQNTVLTMLESKSKIVYPDFQSYLYNSGYVIASLYDKRGGHIYDLNLNTNLNNNLFYDFSKSFRFKLSERIPVNNSNETILTFILTHYYGMFSTSIHFILENGRKSHFINPGQFLYYKVRREINNSKIVDNRLHNSLDQKYEYRFILYGRNNIISHLNFFAEASHIYPQHYFIPNLDKNQLANKKEFLVFLPYPILVLKDEWFSKDYIEFHDRINRAIINVSRNNIITVKTGNKTVIYRDEKEKLDIIYDNINSYYKEKMLQKNYHKGFSYLQKALKMKPENPWLHSALLCLSGDLNIRKGDYKRGLNTLNKSLEFYSHNIDSFQRICEVNLLLNKEKELNVLFDNNKKNRYFFFGLSNGLEIFKIYTYLHFGKFFKAEKIIDKIVLYYNNMTRKSVVNGNPLLKVISDIFTGDYKEAVLISESLRGKNISPFTLNEYRLFYSRAAILSSMYDKEKPEQLIMKLTRFYIEDISKNSITQNHLADISRAYFFAKDGDLTKAGTLLSSGYRELLKMNKGDFFTRFWFFYDMFVYGKTMEILGNKEEAIEGYQASIKANPHTALAKMAKERLSIIEK